MSGAAPTHVAVVGSGSCDEATAARAEAVGAALAEAGCVVVTGGLGGVMEAACRGAAGRGGLTLGLLPGADRRAANPHVRVSVPTGMGELRNGLVVRAADGLIALPGGSGTLSEVALALACGLPVVGLGAHADVAGVVPAEEPEDAVRRLLAAVR